MHKATRRLQRAVTGLVLLCSTGLGSGFAAEGPMVLEPGQDGVQRTTIILDSYSYAPNHIVVQGGKPVELTLKSVTTFTPHNFVLKEPDAGMTVDQSVDDGDTAVVKFTPTRPGTYTFYCDKKLLFFASHREKGMEGRLEVR